MTSSNDGTPTPKKVASLATENARLERMALIGTFGSNAAPGALLLLPGGKVARVATGDRVAGGTVLAIDETRVVLDRMDGQLVLKLPKT
ncbi:MAG: pilus assembly protein PilZ [Sulfitobacter sp.]